MLLYKEISYRIVGAAMEVYRHLGPGFLEAVYEDALCHEFTLQNIPFRRQVEIPVYYKGIEMSTYFADIFVQNEVILEIKAVSKLMDRHFAQAIHYLTATSMRLAILINFGGQTLEYKRIVR